MALRFEVDETVPDGFKRILDEALAEIVSTLRSESVKTTRAVHQTRRGCKRVRGLLRMVRSDLGHRWRSEDQWYRALSGSLSGARDADVRLSTLHRLEKRYEPLVRRRTFKMVGRELEGMRAESTPGRGALRRDAAREMRQARKRMEQLPLRTDGFQVLAVGLADTYDRGAGLFRRASKTGKTQRFHDLRKSVKHLYYQMGTLRSSAPLLVRSMRVRLAELGELLGNAQDLFMLRETLAELGPAPELDVVGGLAAAWENELHQDALRKCEPIFDRSPQEFVRGLETHWRLWKGEEPDSWPPVRGVPESGSAEGDGGRGQVSGQAG